jgi:hypothetical protein
MSGMTMKGIAKDGLIYRAAQKNVKAEKADNNPRFFTLFRATESPRAIRFAPSFLRHPVR